MIARGQNFKQFALNIVGSSKFGRYPKINIEKTYNMFESDHFLVPYAGYKIAINASSFKGGDQGRGIYASVKLGKIVVVIDSTVYLVTLQVDPFTQNSEFQQVIPIGTLQTSSGVVYITENNKPQILISDNTALYIYDPTLSPTFQLISTPEFIPGYVTFHDTYFICAAKSDSFYTPSATNTWRLSGQNDGTTWPNVAQNIGLLQTKSDNIQAVVRFPSKGNMIFVMGETVTESWFDTGAQLFPYQRNNQFNVDYGCLSAATVAYMDEIVVWLGANEKSGPIILYSDGGMPEKITTDGIDYLFSQLNDPADSQAFLYRQDGHLFYHINFYTDNLSLFYDFNTGKFYHASDQNLNYFIAAQLAYFNNQYYFVSKNTGNLYAFDTIFTMYEDFDVNKNIIENEIPRIRSCANVRLPSQEYFIANDVGFTIETGVTNYQTQNIGYPFLVTQDNKYIITQGSFVNIATQDNNPLITQDNKFIVDQNLNINDFSMLISNNQQTLDITPAVDLSISTDGGYSFGNEFRYVLNGIGKTKNRLMWWQAGIANDLICQFKFWGIGRFVATDGILNIRQ